MQTSLSLPLKRFNSRTPGGVRHEFEELRRKIIKFQFTHPGRGATVWGLRFNGRDNVSIHAPREGCDSEKASSRSSMMEFQFTHPGRGATGKNVVRRGFNHVSIHAPREGCD